MEVGKVDEPEAQPQGVELPERVWLPNGVVMLASVSPELKEVEGAYWIRADLPRATADDDDVRVAAINCELAFFFNYWHEQQRHRESSMACRVNECVRVRNLLLPPVAVERRCEGCGHPLNSYAQKYASFAGVICDYRAMSDGPICGHTCLPPTADTKAPTPRVTGETTVEAWTKAILLVDTAPLCHCAGKQYTDPVALIQRMNDELETVRAAATRTEGEGEKAMSYDERINEQNRIRTRENYERNTRRIRAARLQAERQEEERQQRIATLKVQEDLARAQLANLTEKENGQDASSGS